MQNTSNQEFTERSRQQATEELQRAAKKLQQASDPAEQQRWAMEVKTCAERIASFSGGSSRSDTQSLFSIDTVIPTPEVFQQLNQQLSPTEYPGISGIAYRREPNGQHHVTVRATHEVLPQLDQVLSQVGRSVSQAYSGSSSSS